MKITTAAEAELVNQLMTAHNQVQMAAVAAYRRGVPPRRIRLLVRRHRYRFRRPRRQT